MLRALPSEYSLHILGLRKEKFTYLFEATQFLEEIETSMQKITLKPVATPFNFNLPDSRNRKEEGELKKVLKECSDAVNTPYRNLVEEFMNTPVKIRLTRTKKVLDHVQEEIGISY